MRHTEPLSAFITFDQRSRWYFLHAFTFTTHIANQAINYPTFRTNISTRLSSDEQGPQPIYVRRGQCMVSGADLEVSRIN